MAAERGNKSVASLAMKNHERALWEKDVKTHARSRRGSVVISNVDHQARLELEEAWAELMGDSSAGELRRFEILEAHLGGRSNWIAHGIVRPIAS